MKIRSYLLLFAVFLIFILTIEGIVYLKKYYPLKKETPISDSRTESADFQKPSGQPKYENISIKLEDYQEGYIQEGEETNFILGFVQDVGVSDFIIKVEKKNIKCQIDENTKVSFLLGLEVEKSKVELADFSDLKKGDQVSLFSYKGEDQLCPLVTGLTIIKK